ncbi:MAG: hypothetical protein N3C12_14315 [Candidatus Binatia bacterium]|nr:hypothetical protein [Candidatus Binatia bacterium]
MNQRDGHTHQPMRIGEQLPIPEMRCKYDESFLGRTRDCLTPSFDIFDCTLQRL